MRILHIGSSDSDGGAAIASFRLHRSLCENGIDSKMLVQSKKTDDPNVFGPLTSWNRLRWRINASLDTVPVRLYKDRLGYPFTPGLLSFDFVQNSIQSIDPDIVHLHWIGNGTMGIRQLARIKKPIVWSLHDSWAFTGGCHLPGDCEKYSSGCGSCPSLGSRNYRDLSFSSFRRKINTYKRINKLYIVGLSRWMKERAEKSKLLASHRVIHIANPIDTSTFKQIERGLAREILGLPIDGKLILFGSAFGARDPNKGFDLLEKALAAIPEKKPALILLGPANVGNSTGATLYPLGRLHDEVSMRIAYSAADAVIIPSRQETLPNMAIEAMACSIPVVAFNTSGLTDIIDHQVNGYLARPFDPIDLAAGIEWVLTDSLRSELGIHARQKAVGMFDSTPVSREYIKLYDEILNSK